MSKVNLNFEVDKQLKDQIKRAADLEGKKVLRYRHQNRCTEYSIGIAQKS